MNTISLSDRIIGPDHPVFIVAELSANHNGSLELAVETIHAAREAGADAIKLQTYTADTLTLDCDQEDFLVRGGTPWDGKRLYDLYREAHTPWAWHETLFETARKLGLICFSTPFDKTAVDFLETFDPPAYKIASFEITDHELIRYTARLGKPMLISTGVATLGEIQEAVDRCREAGNDDIVLLQCTSAYPAPPEDANLRTLPNLAETFGVVAGFSDHTLGVTAPVVAVSLGARVIEKHFILDKAHGGPDASFSLDRHEFAHMVETVRQAERLLGEVSYRLTPRRRDGRRFCRSLYVARDIRKGETLTEDNIRSVRPGLGLHPRHWPDVIGRRATRDLPKGTALRFGMFE